MQFKQEDRWVELKANSFVKDQYIPLKVSLATHKG